MKPAPLWVAAFLCFAGCGEEALDPVPIVDVRTAEAPPPGPADTEAPTFPESAELLASAPGRLDATERRVTLRFPDATDDVGVVVYVLRVDGVEAGRVDPNAEPPVGGPGMPAVLEGPDESVVGGLDGVTFAAARTFAVVAVDAAGNESSPLQTTDALAPFWPEDTQVEVQVEGSMLTLAWPAAADDVGVVSYSVQRGEDELASLGPGARRHRFRYEASDTGEVVVVALDEAGHKTRLSAGARLAMLIATQQVDQMLLGALASDSDTLRDVLAGSAVTANAADVMAQSDGIGIATSGGGGTLRQAGSGVDTSGGLGGLSTAGGQLGGIRPTERGRVELAPVGRESGPGVFDDAIVTRMLRVRTSSVRACYERELRADTTIAGNVRVRFTIAPSGTVSDVRLTENTTRSPALGSCVTSTAARLRFVPGPEGGSVTYVSSMTFAPRS